MLGFFSLFNDRQNIVKKNEIFFVHVPDDAYEAEIRESFSKLAKDFADVLDVNTVFLNYGKDKTIEYEFKN